MSGSKPIDYRQDENAWPIPGGGSRSLRGRRVRQLCVAAGYTFGIFLKPVSEEFGWSREAVSLAFGVAAMMIAACSPLLGYLLDRVGARRIILPCVTVFGCAFASLALLTPRLWHLYAIFAILGAVGNGTAHLAYTRAVSTWFDRRRGMALALVMTGGAVGAIVLPPAAQALIGSLGWRGAFAILGAMVLAIGLPVVAPLIRERPGYDRERRDEVGGASVAQAMRSRAFWMLVVVLFLVSIGQNGAITHLSALLTDRGVSSGDAAIAVSLMGAASLLGRLVTGWLLDASSRHGWHSACLWWPRWESLFFPARLAGGRLDCSDPDRRGNGRRGRHHSVSIVAILRPAILFDALWLFVDGIRDCGCDRSGSHGTGL